MSEIKTSVSARVAQLSTLPIKEIWALWDRYFPRRPDKPNREYLQSRLAYKLQEEAFGGLPIETARRLANIGVENSKIKERRKPRDIYLAVALHSPRAPPPGAACDAPVWSTSG